jgi:hypothetical protein
VHEARIAASADAGVVVDPRIGLLFENAVCRNDAAPLAQNRRARRHLRIRAPMTVLIPRSRFCVRRSRF